MVQKSFGSIATITIILLLATSTVLDIVSYYFRKVTMSLLYLESLWVFVDIIFVPNRVYLTSLSISFRFMAIGVLLGIETRQSIATVTIGTALAQITTHLAVFQDSIEWLYLVLTSLMVFATTTAYFMQLYRLAKLRTRLERYALERDDFIRLNEET